jgi:AraC-like DNA-binding protein/quercetin dioxygenase-like cupin family protein
MTKYIDKWTEEAPSSFGEHNDPQHAVTGRIFELAARTLVRPHSHARGQLIHAASGALQVVMETGKWSVPVNQAIWVPGGTEHAVIAREQLSIHTLFVDPCYAHMLPQQCQVVSLSPLMRELLYRAVLVDVDYPAEGPESRLMQVVLDELQALNPEPLYLPMAQDRQIRKIMDALMNYPGDNRTLDEWAHVVGATARTLARRFKRDTGFSFGQWRTRLRLIEGMERLQRGDSVTRVALEMGYANASAFIVMFQRELGVAPGALKPGY